MFWFLTPIFLTCGLSLICSIREAIILRTTVGARFAAEGEIRLLTERGALQGERCRPEFVVIASVLRFGKVRGGFAATSAPASLSPARLPFSA